MWAAPWIALSTVWAGALFVLVSALRGLQRSRYASARAAHSAAHTEPADERTEPYMPAGNPWRVGSTVLVSEDLTRPELNWYGTVLATSRHMVTVRDQSAPYAAVETWKERVFPSDAVL